MVGDFIICLPAFFNIYIYLFILFLFLKKEGSRKGSRRGSKKGSKRGVQKGLGPRFVYSTWKKCSFVYSFVCFLSFFTL